MEPESTLELCLGKTTGMKGCPLLLYADIFDLGLYVGAAAVRELSLDILALVERSTLEQTLAVSLFRS
jgi:hypothetical protein